MLKHTTIRSTIISFTFLVLVFVFTFKMNSHIETALATENQGQIIIETDPLSPQPGDKVKIKVVSYSIDANLSNITWKVGDAVVKSGIGETIYNTTVPTAGNTENINITVDAGSGNTYTSNIVLGGYSVGLTTESADGYTPAWYKGAKLISEGSKIKVIATPEITIKGNLVPSSNIYFAWTVNDTPLDDQSGVGKNTITYTMSPVYGSARVGVVAKTLDGLISSSANTEVVPIQTRLYLYNYNSGKNPQMLSNNHTMTSSQEEISFEPFFASAETATDLNLKYNITLNGIPANTTNNSITIRSKSGESGEGALSIEYEHLKKIVQGAKRVINIKFNNSN